MQLVAVVFVCGLVCGCAFKRSHNYSTAKNYYKTTITSELTDPKLYQRYYSETDEAKKKELRNRLISYCIWLADEDFNRYVTKFSHNQAVLGLFADWSSLAMSGASAIATPAAVFGGIATGIQGAHASYDKNILNQQSRSAIILKMQALRQEKLIEIYQSEQLPDTQYPLIQGLIDMQLYVNAGTVYAAIAAISQDASIQHHNSSEVLKTLKK